jgi:hypothetical protein
MLDFIFPLLISFLWFQLGKKYGLYGLSIIPKKLDIIETRTELISIMEHVSYKGGIIHLKNNNKYKTYVYKGSKE